MSHVGASSLHCPVSPHVLLYDPLSVNPVISCILSSTYRWYQGLPLMSHVGASSLHCPVSSHVLLYDPLSVNPVIQLYTAVFLQVVPSLIGGTKAYL